jgi:putative FmdB family regulatory protein
VPTYQYACTDCAERLEVVQKFTDEPLTVCSTCGGRLRKVFSPVGIVFKGSGFYRTDSRVSAEAPSSANGSAASEPSANGKDSGSGSPGGSGEKAGAAAGSSGSSPSAGSSGSGSSGSSASKVA